MSRLYRNHVAAQERAPEILREIQQRFAKPDYDVVKHFANAYGLHWEDACEVERLEREIDKLNAQACRIGLSPTDRQRIYELELQQDRFIKAAQRHARSQHARKASANA